MRLAAEVELEASQARIARLVAVATEVQETNRQVQRTYRDGQYDHEEARLHLLASEAHAAAHHHLTDVLGDLAAPAQEGKLSPADLAELTHVVSDQEIWEDHQAAFQPVDLPAREGVGDVGRILWRKRGGEIDEIVLRDVDIVHVEQMDDDCWWIGITLKSGGYWAGNFYARGKSRLTFTEQERDGFEWDRDDSHADPAQEEGKS